MLVDDGALVEGADGAWIAATTLAEVRVPASISVLLSARLERLAPDERAVAERASVVGRVFEQAAVAELASDALRPAVGRSLLALVRKELVRPERSELSAGDAFTFRHILIRDAAYEALPKVERAVLHERFADWLERDRRRTPGRVRGDRRLPPRAGPPLPNRARRDRRGGGGPRRAGRTTPGRGGWARLRPRGRRDRRDPPRACRRRVPGRIAGQAAPHPGPRVRPLLERPGPRCGTTHRRRRRRGGGRGRVGDSACTPSSNARSIRVLSAGEHSTRRALAESAIPRLEAAGDDLGLARAYLVIASADWIEGRVEDAMAARRRAIAYAASAGDIRIERRSTCWGVECYGPAPAARCAREPRSVARSVRRRSVAACPGVVLARGRVRDARPCRRLTRGVSGAHGDPRRSRCAGSSRGPLPRSRGSPS